MSKENCDKCNEVVCTEPDETGKSIVYKDNTFYYKNTYKMDNGTANVYMHIPMKKKKTSDC